MAHPRREHRGLAALLSVLALASCGGAEEAPPSAGAPIPSGGLSVSEAKVEDADPQEQVSVLGDVDGDVISLSATER